MLSVLHRVGSIVAKGNLRSVQIEGAGVSKVYLKGSLRNVYVDLNGISQVHLAPTSGLSCSLQYRLSKLHSKKIAHTECICRFAVPCCMCLFHGKYCSNARQRLAEVWNMHKHLHCLL